MFTITRKLTIMAIHASSFGQVRKQRISGPFIVKLLSFMVLLALTMRPLSLSAQVSTADVVGTITDPSGAVIIGAKVAILNVDTGIVRSTLSNDKGEYIFALLQVGAYRVTVDAPGFQKFVTSSMKLSAGDRARVDAAMIVGSASETVAVNAGTAPALDTDSSTVGSLIPDQVVHDAPLNGRNLTDLVRLSAGVSTGLGGSGAGPALVVGYSSVSEDSRPYSAYSANGQSGNVNTNLLDGSENNERVYGIIGARPSLDAVQEVSVQTNLYTAEVGRTAGGAVDIITKSGTNKLQGSVYEYLRNDLFDSKLLSGQPKAELRQNQFGGSLGGPIKKGKTFFFADYEGYRQIAGSANTELVPTDDERTGNFSSLCAPGSPSAGSTLCTNYNGGVLTALDPVGAAYVSLYPHANYSGSPTYNYISTALRGAQNTGTYDARIDHHINQANTLIGHYTLNDYTTAYAGEFPGVTLNGTTVYGGGNETADQLAEKVSLDYVHVFSTRLLLNLKASYMRYSNQAMPSNSKGTATLIGFPCNDTSCVNTSIGGAESGIPQILFPFNSYATLGDQNSLPLRNYDDTYQYASSVIWSRGTHSIKSGIGLIRRQALFLQGGAGAIGRFNFEGELTGNPIADLLLGAAQMEIRGPQLVAQHLRTWEPSAYIQDDWRFNKRLTLNLGVRYDVFTPYTEKDGYIANFDLQSELVVSPSLLGDNHTGPTAGVSTQFTNFAPRLGFSASLGHNMVVRGGFGMTYFVTAAGQGAANYTGVANPPFLNNAGCGIAGSEETIGCTGDFVYSDAYTPASLGYAKLSAGLPLPVFDVTLATDRSNYSGLRVYGTSPNMPTPYLEQWSLQLEKQLGANVFTLGYVGNAGRHLTVNDNANQQVTETNGTTYYPLTLVGGTAIWWYSDFGTSSYNALQLLYSRRFAKGLTTNATYTWSHDLDVTDAGGQIFCPAKTCLIDNPSGSPITSGPLYDWGNSSLDLRHHVTAMSSYELPFGKSLKGAMGEIAKGWGVYGTASWETGAPFSVSNGHGLSGTPFMSDRPDMIANPYKAGNVTLPNGTTCTGPSALNVPVSYNGSVAKYAFNPCAFLGQTPGTFGNERRNQLFGPHTWTMNMAAGKEFPIYENMRLLFRAEAFNFTNTTNDSSPGNTLGGGFMSPGPSTLGIVARGANAGRQVQFALRLSF
jgi:hypothetical protein